MTLRPLALAVALAGSPAAQPITPSASGVRLTTTDDDVRLGKADPSPIYIGTVATLSSAVGAAFTGSVSVLVLGAAVVLADDCLMCGGDGSPVPFAVAFVAGGIVGATLSIRVLGAMPRRPYALLPDPGIDRDDWRRALVGALAGTVPGLAVALLVPSESGGEWLAVPIAQGLGAGIAVAL